MPPPASVTSDPWGRLRRHTAARIALGRAGASLPTAEVLRFAAAHAAARDAVHAEFDLDALEGMLSPLGLPILRLATLAPHRLTYLQRPDLGRTLDEPSGRLLRRPGAGADLAIIVADGLSAQAAQRHAAPLLEILVPMLRGAGIALAPLCVVTQARVVVEDEIGAALGARAALVLLGERPGLGSADSLGAYLIYDPRPGKTDADRNCVSNIRPGGLPLDAAAETIRSLVLEALRRRISGVALKDPRGPPPALLPRAAGGSASMVLP